jgi:hypothetical protein
LRAQKIKSETKKLILYEHGDGRIYQLRAD